MVQVVPGAINIDPAGLHDAILGRKEVPGAVPAGPTEDLLAIEGEVLPAGLLLVPAGHHVAVGVESVDLVINLDLLILGVVAVAQVEPPALIIVLPGSNGAFLAVLIVSCRVFRGGLLVCGRVLGTGLLVRGGVLGTGLLVRGGGRVLSSGLLNRSSSITRRTLLEGDGGRIGGDDGSSDDGGSTEGGDHGTTGIDGTHLRIPLKMWWRLTRSY